MTAINAISDAGLSEQAWAIDTRAEDRLREIDPAGVADAFASLPTTATSRTVVSGGSAGRHNRTAQDRYHADGDGQIVRCTWTIDRPTDSRPVRIVDLCRRPAPSRAVRETAQTAQSVSSSAERA